MNRAFALAVGALLAVIMLATVSAQTAITPPPITVPTGAGTLTVTSGTTSCGTATAGAFTVPSNCSAPGSVLTFKDASGNTVGSTTLPSVSTTAPLSPVTVALPANAGSLTA